MGSSRARMKSRFRYGMYSSTAGTGLSSAPSGSQIRAAIWHPSFSEMKTFSISFTPSAMLGRTVTRGMGASVFDGARRFALWRGRAFSRVEWVHQSVGGLYFAETRFAPRGALDDWHFVAAIITGKRNLPNCEYADVVIFTTCEPCARDHRRHRSRYESRNRKTQRIVRNNPAIISMRASHHRRGRLNLE